MSLAGVEAASLLLAVLYGRSNHVHLAWFDCHTTILHLHHSKLLLLLGSHIAQHFLLILLAHSGLGLCDV